MWQNFQQSRFAQLKPLMVEQPFTLYIGEGISVHGRIDAIYEGEDGDWEIVDFKTGKSDPDPLQLAIYAARRRGDLGQEGRIVLAATANGSRAGSAGSGRSEQSASEFSRCSDEARTQSRGTESQYASLNFSSALVLDGTS